MLGSGRSDRTLRNHFLAFRTISGFFPPESNGNRSYGIDYSTGSFCLHNATLLEVLAQVDDYLSHVHCVLKTTDADGQDGVDLFDLGWQRADLAKGAPLYIEELEQLLAIRISRLTLPTVITSITAALNNMNYAATNERVTGSYIVREIILVPRWEWLTVLFGIELLGMGYSLYIIFRPRTTAGV